ncbi:MAG: VOC family protein, partial [Okeania sp. SIO2H7]|nr:VOC family protein [Okeania sp. SIO2H7]
METKFPVELDHFFVWVQPKAPEAKILFDELGLHRSGYGEHTGQATASEFFFFENAYLELLWIDDEEKVKEDSYRTTMRWCDRSRWRETGASPFGVGLHRLASAEEELALFPLRYSAEWMLPETYMEVSDTSKQVTEPLYFIVPEYMAVANVKQFSEIITTDIHPWGDKKVTSVRISLPKGEELSPIASEISRHTAIAIESGDSYLLELT